MYEAERVGLGEEFDDAVRNQLARIERWPRAYPTVYRHVRRALLRRFPYAIYFVLVPTDDAEVIAILHQRRHPEIWRGRV